MKIGIIGKKLSGKSTIYGALTGLDISDMYEKKIYFHSVDVYDERMPKLSEIYHAKRDVYNKLVFYDFPGYDLNNSELKSMDGYIMVIGNHHSCKELPSKQLEDIFSDLYLNDLTILQKRHDIVTRGKKKTDFPLETKIITELLTLLEKEKNVYNEFKDEEKIKFVKGFQLFSIKPIFVIVNNDENKKFQPENTFGFPIFEIMGEIEREVTLLPMEEQKEYLEMMGIEIPLIKKFAGGLYKYLNLITFFSCSEKEIKAWQLKKGQTIYEAAGAIHTDIMQGFIRANIVNADDILKYKNEKLAKENGCYHLEKKEYITQDGDIVDIRFQKK